MLVSRTPPLTLELRPARARLTARQVTRAASAREQRLQHLRRQQVELEREIQHLERLDTATQVRQRDEAANAKYDFENDLRIGTQASGPTLSMTRPKWVPLESNPDVLNKFLAGIGLDTSRHALVDVLGLDPELLALVPRPCLAVILLFPYTDAYREGLRQEDAQLRAGGYEPSGRVFYVKQLVGNTCGTVAVLHAVANNAAGVTLDRGSFLQRFTSDGAALDPQRRGEYVAHTPEGVPSLKTAHEAAAQEGSTAVPGAHDPVEDHFITLVHSHGRLVELDGMREFPIDHGPTTPDTLLQDAAVVARQVMDKIDSHHFVLMALAAADPDP